jgi:hypothetical protein
MPLSCTRLSATLLLAFLQSSCAQHQGNFAALAGRSVHYDIDRAHWHAPDRTSGRACFSLAKTVFAIPDDAITRATDEALRPFPDANALVLVEIQDYGPCVEITGLAVKIK